jgi:hypothetical protein
MTAAPKVPTLCPRLSFLPRLWQPPDKALPKISQVYIESGLIWALYCESKEWLNLINLTRRFDIERPSPLTNTHPTRASESKGSAPGRPHSSGGIFGPAPTGSQDNIDLIRLSQSQSFCLNKTVAALVPAGNSQLFSAASPDT